MLIGADSPEEERAVAIWAAHSQVIPDSLLLASPRGDPAGVRRLGKLEESAGAARRRTKAQERRRFPAAGGVPPGVAERFGDRPAAPLGVLRLYVKAVTGIQPHPASRTLARLAPAAGSAAEPDGVGSEHHGTRAVPEGPDDDKGSSSAQAERGRARAACRRCR